MMLRVLIFLSLLMMVLPQEEGDVRLLHGRTQYEGLVEIFHDNSWGTICHDNWDNDDAYVVCKQLGFPYEHAASIRNSFFGKGTNAKIWLDDVDCDLGDDTLTDCGHRGWGIENCDPKKNDEASVICSDISGVRLLGPASHFGRIEVQYGGIWIPVCRNTYEGFAWNDETADIVCRQLGFEKGGQAVERYARDLVGMSSSVPFRAYDVTDCIAGTSTLSDCVYNVDTMQCSSNRQAIVFCNGELLNGFRLVDGDTERPNPNTGRLQVRQFSSENYLPYEWLDVCGDDINDEQFFASYACKELGYTDGGYTVYYQGHELRTSKPNVTISECNADGCTLVVQDRSCNLAAGVSCYTSRNCPEGYTPFQNSCYKVYETLASRCDAVCASPGHLVDITTHEEHQFVTNLLSKQWSGSIRQGNGDAWFGLMMNARNSETLIWSDGSPLQYESWSGRARKDGHSCFHMIHRYGYGWEESDCEIQKRFVCEVEGNGNFLGVDVYPQAPNPACTPTTLPPPTTPSPTTTIAPARQTSTKTTTTRQTTTKTTTKRQTTNTKRHTTRGTTSVPTTTNTKPTTTVLEIMGVPTRAAISTSQTTLLAVMLVGAVICVLLIVFLALGWVFVVVYSRRMRNTKPTDHEEFDDHSSDHSTCDKVSETGSEGTNASGSSTENAIFRTAVRASKRFDPVTDESQKITYIYNGAFEPIYDELNEENIYSEEPTRQSSESCNYMQPSGWNNQAIYASKIEVQNAENEPRYVPTNMTTEAAVQNERKVSKDSMNSQLFKYGSLRNTNLRGSFRELSQEAIKANLRGSVRESTRGSLRAKNWSLRKKDIAVKKQRKRPKLPFPKSNVKKANETPKEKTTTMTTRTSDDIKNVYLDNVLY